ncbi:phosphatidylserine decarboxylase [Chromobacterium subtsugae]|uniref:Phosphatidylserine decarboxylase proenzyme n=1 Tax=Chromobacterium subtsugae TaxID=251747 RepID=A0ABS7FE97_9NEIS|nr:MULTISPECIES: archaetidylserine decarboxylase [Chromobacterium]KUM03864.1 phosphatidylserine decarboxylase [Chromobacterium subtsugae]KZE87475.1 phosphatidylserine decarboxylase [Chromobacterium sp. F49]MBW7566624.1 phosphatidylserine decarboxylase [Chromobacterium subtsugae]MBW8288311.1 phosphatidylserine decarboxylase [Chromobacterium subtsugae]OBU87240.1 phosphatidylserine decarboxylase [Chromobacterium subtsugae]
MSERLFVLSQHVMPKLALTRFAGCVAGWKGGSLTTALIRRFIARYNVDMSEAQNSDPASYASFNDFFTRALKPGVRPLADARQVCPVDGAVSQLGAIDNGRIFQAKGRDYSATALLAGDAELAARFADGHFATIYLSPRDYHRIHMPCAGRLLEMTYVPGELYSVNPATARGVDRLFARNERVVCLFEDEQGQPFVMVLVGATIVGSMATVWHGVVNPPRRPALEKWDYRSQDIRLAKGEEMGRFLLGSTVVLLYPAGPLRFNPQWQPASPVRLGEKMAD